MNRQYMPGLSIPTVNTMTSNLAAGAYVTICEACRSPQTTDSSGTIHYLPHTAGSFDCIAAIGARLEALIGLGVGGPTVLNSMNPVLVSLENKLRGDYLAADTRLEKAMKVIVDDVSELRESVREYASHPLMVLKEEQ